MRRRRWIVGMVALATLALSGGIEASAAPGPVADTARVCPPVPGQASCNAIQLLNPGLNWAGTHAAAPAKSQGKGPGKKPPGGGGSTTPSGYGPADLQSAYGLTTESNPTTNPSPIPTVAVVDAYNDPNAASDLATYRKQFGLPACSLSTGAGCVTVEGQSGSTTSLPRSNASWSEEISLDLDMVSAICPYCHILLVEATSASFADLGTAVDTAYQAGAVAISNSYGASEFSGETSYDTYYSHGGVAVTASAGDSGYGVEYPAASPYVVAVGGTSLTGSTTTSWSQTVWSGTGSGCSAYESNPGWQPSVSNVCTKRTVGDVAAVADPNTGVAVYDSFHEPGWMVFGGTSVASPIVASIFALAGNTTTFSASSSSGYSTAAEAFYSKDTSGSYPLTRVTYGSNGSCGTYLCNAADGLSAYNGYNGPTGMGTPNGISGF